MPNDFFHIAYRVRDCGAALGIPVHHVRKAIRRGELRPRQLPGTMTSVLPADELLAWIKSQPNTPPRVTRNPYGRKGAPRQTRLTANEIAALEAGETQ